MIRTLRAFIYSLPLVVAVAGSVGAAKTPQLEPTTCGLPDIGDVLPRLRCGVVRVPRDYAHPDGPSFGLAVVVISSAQQPALADPVVYISGGPGSPLTIYAGFQARHPYVAERDLILVDQRGTGRSEPSLCPELQGALVNAMLAVVVDPTPEALAASRAALAACREAIGARGIDLDDFGTMTTAEDYERVRQALGVTRWNVVGESYGTTVAMTLLATHSRSIRSAVLDSLNPPDKAFAGMPWSARMALARDAFLAACTRGAPCATAHPGLAGLYRAVLARLAQAPPTIVLPAALQVPDDHLRLTSPLFEEVVGRLVYDPSNYEALPGLIAATRDGDMAPLTRALAGMIAEAKRAGNEAAFVAVECRDTPRWRMAASGGESPLDLALLPPGVCPAWSALGPAPEIPRGTAVPTLILAGQFDPNIRPEQSLHVADELGHKARWVEFAGIGHNVRHFSSCAQAAVAAFIVDPDGELDTDCASKAKE